ncbi:EF-P lysine aminoacylase EpmA [Halomonas urumqiensis]|uniref:Elongation factor P lysine(34) lysyltransferase n=1 Tax=Halomonas urumqiensis TaxID=1684789 RepID=A0A2N7UCV5_9GAMM|nr:EF-P lysine aminoacylase EpmA [Halomonas urumqiensis]PMR78221.1 elongation factor P lysine(34) lysyltransferase [Halomonas urumqiensis]PTB03369.1 EF-P lysine aminoacylase GenX [Halomonas urumqiensis]GHE20464.1 elongation factor P--(R)-beta-lysine ligase [Halomonas urumqiensis]
METDWRPTASIETLRERARLLAVVRAFFAARDVLEVETPVLGHGGSSDVHLASLSTQAATPAGRERLWLQTSPEFHMKRLLAAGSGPIFQLARSFRDGEVGRRHNIEFTMLEWYRPGMPLPALIEETSALVGDVLGRDPGPLRRCRYRELFRDILSIDPFTTALSEIRSLASERGGLEMDDASRDDCLDLLMSLAIEPTLGHEGIDVVVDYPASQAALARRHQDSEDGEWVASRFELYLSGMELANGYDELTDAAEQRQRFTEDNASRRALGLPEVDVDERLLAALEAGMPKGSGVALGLDRLIQLALGKASVAEVMAFATPRC